MNPGERPSYEIKVEAYADALKDKDLELSLNKAQVDSNSILRTIISYEDSYLKVNFVIYQDSFTEDRIYMISEYPEYLNEEYRQIILNASTPDAKNLSRSGDFQMTTDQHIR